MEKINILLADDHPLFRKALCQLLKRAGTFNCVAVAEDGEQAVKLAQEFVPDVVIMDVDMPKMTGIEATKSIKSSCPKTAVLILSAYKCDRYILSCIRVGASGYLLKTALPEDLIDAIHKVHSGKKVYDVDATSRILSRSVCSNDGKYPGSGELQSRELQVLKLIARGKTNKEISRQLGISDHTVGTHVAHIFRKLGVESRTEAALRALQQDYFTIDDVVDK